MTTTYSVSRDTIITAALRKLQVIELGVTPDADTVVNAAQSLNFMIKSWQTQGIKLWTIQNYVVPLTASTNAYTIGNVQTKTGTVTITNATPAVVTYTSSGLITGTPVVFTTTGALPTGITAGTTYYVLTALTASTFTIATTVGGTAINTSSAGSGVHTCTITTPTSVTQTNNKPLKVIQAWMRNTSVTPNIDTPLMLVSRQEYNILGSKASTGMINTVWYNPDTTYGTVTVFLTPDATTATNYQLYLVGQRPINDILLSTDIPDFPNEWMQALVWGLADEIAIEYGAHVNVRQEIHAKAEKYRTDLEDFDVETTSTMFTPDRRTF